MEELEGRLDCIHQAHVKNEIRGLFAGLTPGFLPMVGSRTFVVGDVTDFGTDWLQVMAHWFVPGAGFSRPVEDKCIKICFHDVCRRGLHVCPGIQVMCTGLQTSKTTDDAVVLDHATIGFRPEYSAALPWDAVHFFSGTFCGWSQGLHYVDGTICLGQEVYIDHDVGVMELWSVKNQANFRPLPLQRGTSWSPARRVGLCGPISDITILEACRSQANLLNTMSPPCQSWSKGGKRAGLEDANGRAFLDALVQNFGLQSLAIAAECADDVVSHPQFKLVKSLAHALGFKLVWDQVTPYHPLTTHARSRWLGVWVRADVAVQMIPFQLNLPCAPRSHWTDQAYQFFLPQVWTSQLRLSSSECQIYDSIQSLPPAKRAKFDHRAAQSKEIIRSRVPDSSQVLPTLCASYTRQHTLHESHLSAKGIFASLRESADGFHFFDPAMFCSLFGATEHVVMSTKVAESFRVVGNAITVPHSVLALAIVLHTTDASRVDPVGLVRQVWTDRMTTHNAILFEDQQFVHLIPKSEFWDWVQIRPELPDSGRRTCCVTGACVSRDFSFRARPDQTIKQLFREQCQGPPGLLEQICALNSDMRINDHTTVEQIARQEGSVRLVIGFCTLGSCDIICHARPTDPTKVIPSFHAEDRGEVDQILHIEMPTFDTIVQTSIFWDIRHAIQTLQDGGSNTASKLSIVILPEQFSLTVYIPRAHHKCLIEKIGELPAIRSRNKTSIIVPGENSTTLMVSEARDCDENQMCDVIFRVPQDLIICGATLQSDRIPDAIQLSQHDAQLRVDLINGTHRPANDLRLRCGDVIDLCVKSTIHAGGHHAFNGAPPSLPALSDFTARVEFMCDTHGWVASDEVFHYTQALQWQQNWLRFGSPQLWNPANGDFEPPVFGELHIMNNANTAIPVLIGSHWAGIEIDRRGDQVQVTFIQVPASLHTALTFLVGRLLDIAPHRFQVNTEQSDPPDHLCGWLLIYRWYLRHGLQDGIADTTSHITLNGEYNELIQLAMQCSSEDWAQAQMSNDVGRLAYTLRKNFLCFLGRREMQGRPHPQVALQTACPPLGNQPTLQIVQPVPANGQAPPRIDRSRLVTERIRFRLAQILRHPGWMTSDELDIALEAPRALNPMTLFCAPASWNVGASHLHFYNDIIPDYRAYNQVIWIIEVDQHWVQAEAYLHEEASNFAFTFPAESRILLQPLVNHLVNITGARDTQVSVHFYDQVAPQHMCGYHLVAVIYQRLTANCAPLQPAQRRVLSFHPLAADFDRAQYEARELWIAAQAHPHLIEFASRIRAWYLVRVAENRFPIQFIAAGAAPDDDVTMKPAEVKPASGGTSRASASPSTEAKDPWLKADPWLRSTPRPAQSRWEDLIIKEPTPFTGTDGSNLTQTHRLQVGAARGGIVFATKANVQEILKAGGSSDLAILLPASDNISLPNVTQKLQGPFELSVDDIAAKIAYKRLVMMLVVRGTINFKLPEPIAKVTTGAICEVVLEIDSRLTNKSDFERFKDSPISSFKALLGEIVPNLDSSAAIFGFRVGHHPSGSKQEPLLQCILKAPHAVRTPLIEASGFSPLLTRDFLEKGKNSEDTSVLPRFWPPTMPELANIRKTVEGTEGLAGLVLTRRGIAPRVWISKIGKDRAQLLAEDPRVLPENIDIVPRYTFSFAGWPAATGAQHVVKSTMQALRLPVLPLRTYRAAGVHVWIATCDKKPVVTSFPLQINADVVEILIQEVDNTQPKPGKAAGKGGPKGKAKMPIPAESAKSWSVAPAIVPSGSKADDARLQRLEERFEKIESRQATFEARVDGKFDTIQDALRQILVNTNGRSREPTGESPPAKALKQS